MAHQLFSYFVLFYLDRLVFSFDFYVCDRNRCWCYFEDDFLTLKPKIHFFLIQLQHIFNFFNSYKIYKVSTLLFFWHPCLFQFISLLNNLYDRVHSLAICRTILLLLLPSSSGLYIRRYVWYYMPLYYYNLYYICMYKTGLCVLPWTRKNCRKQY